MTTLPLPDGEQFARQLRWRHLRGGLWQRFFFLAIIVGIAALLALVLNTVNDMFGYVEYQFVIDPDTLAEGRPLDSLSEQELMSVLITNVNFNRRRVLLRDGLLDGAYTGEAFTTTPMSEMLANLQYPPAIADKTIRDVTEDELNQIFDLNLDQAGLLEFINTEIVGRQIVKSWTLLDSILHRGEIEAEVTGNPATELHFRSWLSASFLSNTMSSDPLQAGIRTAFLGTLWVVVVTVVVAFPLGVGAALYLEEYAGGSWINRIIETNIRNLAGVPSIIYGLLGLAIFVRVLGSFTGGRSILSASLTMALLILPIIIINAQEAIRAVPWSIREASYGMGATRWQTIWNQVIPAAMPGILTGTILAMSRAIGETAPLIVIGAATFITFDPTGLQSNFTVLPIQIYDWAKRPQQEFHNLAASTIIVLLIVLLSLNATAIVLRQRFRKKLQG